MDCSISDNFLSFHFFSYSVQKGKNSLELECFTNFAEGEKRRLGGGGALQRKMLNFPTSLLLHCFLLCYLVNLLFFLKM